MLVKGSMRGNHLPRIRRRSPQALASSPRGSPVQTESLVLEASQSYLHEALPPRTYQQVWNVFPANWQGAKTHTAVFPSTDLARLPFSDFPNICPRLACACMCVCMLYVCVSKTQTLSLSLFFPYGEDCTNKPPLFFPSTVWK